MKTKKIFFSGWGFQASGGDGLRGIDTSYDFLNQQSLPTQDPCILVGWSLGGQAAMQLALQQPQNVSALILIASTPRFCASETWQHGCSERWFDAFKKRVEKAPIQALQRFNALMLQGEKHTRLQRQTYLETMEQALILEKEALLQGLQMLHQHDLREDLRAIKVPVLLIHGEKDQIIPCGASAWMAQEIPKASQYIIKACGHAPLWTHPEQVNQVMESWCQQII